MPITVLIAIALLIVLWLFLSKKHPTVTDRLARFWSKPKYPTKYDIARKYPKAKHLQQQSLERRRREAREKDRLESERKQAILDRHIKEVRATNNLGKIKNYDQGHGIRCENLASRAELRLSAYLFYDQKKAARLVDGVQARYPDKSREWCADKALVDLERDRQMR